MKAQSNIFAPCNTLFCVGPARPGWAVHVCQLHVDMTKKEVAAKSEFESWCLATDRETDWSKQMKRGALSEKIMPY